MQLGKGRTTPEVLDVIRRMAMSDRGQATTRLNALPPVPVAPTPDEPPMPMHDPGALPPGQAERAAETERLIKSIRAEGAKFSSYDAALNEARRRRPELFS